MRVGGSVSDEPQLLPSLVLHDGELSDVTELLGHLGVRHVERHGAASFEEELARWELVIATPKRVLEFDPGPSGTTPMRVAVVDKDSKTLRAMLRRAGIDLVVRRPVHPAALRLLILHCLYRGPEKRRALRVSVGARVRFRAGLRLRQAVLADLSLSGCRMLCDLEIEPGREVKIQIPEELCGGKPFQLSGAIARVEASEFPGIHVLAVKFAGIKPRVGQRLRETIAAYASGPAALAPGDAAAKLVPGVDPAHGAGRQERCADERRVAPRHAYEERIVALGVEAARVLLGRDISIGGMRVESHPSIAVGDCLRIGMHVRGREQPLVVNARVIRDEAERGAVLQFFDLDEPTQDYLDRTVRFLPILATRRDADDAGVIVCEILDHEPGPPEPPEPAAAEAA